MTRFSEADIAEIRARLPLSELIARVANVSWDRKRSKPGKRDWHACCPFHGEKTPSFHADDRKGFYKCFGCPAKGDLFTFLREFEGLDFKGAVERAAGLAGVQLEQASAPDPDAGLKRDMAARERAARDERLRAAQAREDEQRRQWGADIWASGVPAPGTLVETYLKFRGIPVSPPRSLRFHPALPHKPSGQSFPAMLGCMQGPGGGISGVHRTYLKPDGQGKADVIQNKMMLGLAEAACVRLTPAAPLLYLAEGIETSLRVLQLKPDAHVWAALSLGNLARAWLPEEVREVVIVADNDQKDWRAGKRAVRAAVDAHAAAGRLVRVIWPPRGMDFDDWGRMAS